MPEPPVVVYVLRAFPTLTETFVLNEILGLERRGVRVVIESLRAPADEPRHPQLRELAAPVRHLASLGDRRRAMARAHLALLLRNPARWLAEARLARSNGTWGDFKVGGLIARRAHRAGASNIHVHFAYSAPPAVHAAKLSGLPCTVHVHAWDIYHHTQAPLIHRRLGRVDALVTESQHNVDHLGQVLPDVPARRLPPGVEVSATADVPPDGPLLTVGRLIPKKGLDILIGALPAVIRDAPGTRLEIIGDGPLRGELEERVRALQLERHVVFRGSQGSDTVQGAFRQCSMFVLPCRIDADGDRDGLPTVLVEALSFGVPVVTTNIIGIPELVRDGETGLLVPPEDPQALAKAILTLANDHELGRALGSAGRELIRAEYSPEGTASRLAELFGETARASTHA